MDSIEVFHKKKFSEYKLDYSFLLISLYFFLIIFFVLLTCNFVIDPEYSKIAKKSIMKQFHSTDSILTKLLPKNIYAQNFSKFYSNKILEYVEKFPDKNINNYSKNEIINFNLTQDLFFNDKNEIEMDRKILLSQFIDILNLNNTIEIKLRILLSYQKIEELDDLKNKLDKILILLNNIQKKYNLQIGFVHNKSQDINFSFYY